MREQIVTLGSGGTARDVGTRGHGFRLVPARPPSSTQRPGAYPIRVTTNEGRVYEVTADDARLLSEPFTFLTLSGGESGDAWKVQIFESPAESVIPPGQRGSVAVPVQATATAAATGTPTGTQGFKVRPGFKSWTFYGTGTREVARLWVRSASGNWHDTGEDLDFTLSPVQTRTVIASADRIELVTAAGTLLLEVDAEVEVG